VGVDEAVVEVKHAQAQKLTKSPTKPGSVNGAAGDEDAAMSWTSLGKEAMQADNDVEQALAAQLVQKRRESQQRQEDIKQQQQQRQQQQQQQQNNRTIDKSQGENGSTVTRNTSERNSVEKIDSNIAGVTSTSVVAGASEEAEESAEAGLTTEDMDLG